MKISRRSLSVSVMLALALAARPSAAIVATSGELMVNSYTTTGQYLPAIAMAGDHSFVVTWASQTQDGSGKSIRGRRFDRVGTPLTGELPINQVTEGDQLSPAVASRPDGTFVVAWDHDYSEIRARLFAVSGVPLGDEMAINAYTTGQQQIPSVDFLPDGSFMTAWRSSGQDGSGDGIYARRFLSSGSGAAEFRLPTATSGDQDRPVLRARLDGTLVAAWDDALLDGGNEGIFSERLNASGTAIGADIQVNAYTTGYQRLPAIDVAHDGSYVVTWFSAGPSGRVAARRFASDGTALTGDRLIGARPASPLPAYAAAVASNVDGSFVVAWPGDDGADYTDQDIHMREFDAAGVAIGDELLANTYTTGPQTAPEIAMEPGGFFAVTWASNPASPFEGTDVKARVFRADRIVAEDFATAAVPSYWTAVNPDGDLALTPAAGLAGTDYGLELTVDDTNPIYLQSDLPRAEGLFRVRFYLDPNGFTVGTDGDRTKILQLFTTDPVQRRLVTLVLRVQGGQYRLLAKAHQDDDSWVNTGFHTISDLPHVVELLFLREGGLFPGALWMWIDGVQVASLSDVENEDGGRVDFVRWGVLSVQPGASGALFFDLFESRRQSYIGP